MKKIKDNFRSMNCNDCQCSNCLCVCHLCSICYCCICYRSKYAYEDWEDYYYPYYRGNGCMFFIVKKI